MLYVACLYAFSVHQYSFINAIQVTRLHVGFASIVHVCSNTAVITVWVRLIMLIWLAFFCLSYITHSLIFQVKSKAKIKRIRKKQLRKIKASWCGEQLAAVPECMVGGLARRIQTIRIGLWSSCINLVYGLYNMYNKTGWRGVWQMYL